MELWRIQVLQPAILVFVRIKLSDGTTTLSKFLGKEFQVVTIVYLCREKEIGASSRSLNYAGSKNMY